MADIEKALSMLAAGTAVGDRFFEIAAAALVQGLGCRWAGICCLSDDGISLKVLSLAGSGAPLELGRFPLEGMPAALLYADPSSGRLHITDQLAARFPKYPKLLGVDLHRYSAAIFRHSDGRPAIYSFLMTRW